MVSCQAQLFKHRFSNKQYNNKLEKAKGVCQIMALSCIMKMTLMEAAAQTSPNNKANRQQCNKGNES